jgi:hypothetical protein
MHIQHIQELIKQNQAATMKTNGQNAAIYNPQQTYFLLLF